MHRARKVTVSGGGSVVFRVVKHSATGPAKTNPIYQFNSYRIYRKRFGILWGWYAENEGSAGGFADASGASLSIVADNIIKAIAMLGLNASGASSKMVQSGPTGTVTVTPAPGSSPEVVKRLKRAFAPTECTHADKSKCTCFKPTKCTCPKDLPLHLSDCPLLAIPGFLNQISLDQRRIIHPEERPACTIPAVASVPKVEKGEAWARRAMKRITDSLHGGHKEPEALRVPLSALSTKVENAKAAEGICQTCGGALHSCVIERSLRNKIQQAKEALADAHESLTSAGERENAGDSEFPAYVHSAIASCECSTAKAYREMEG